MLVCVEGGTLDVLVLLCFGVEEVAGEGVVMCSVPKG